MGDGWRRTKVERTTTTYARNTKTNLVMRPGLGFGVGCLRQDIRGFIARAGGFGCDQAAAILHDGYQPHTRTPAPSGTRSALSPSGPAGGAGRG
ncbi:hypothetical protein DEJ48_02760 [Streptomyces venezuelae]|uniref:Uncharacterized protein n=1 Tax=Streptomyces venezuelae TaxID=54571 RepID=A0A5P2BPQ8_STRVZ|nr:hypothetical protein [Streptomyces venezuelae]QES32465.1 hypothetical protein DEJ48_02760 [Streptomyces venezuelae]